MDYTSLLLLLSFAWTCLHVLRSNWTGRQVGTAKLPPGPQPFPIIGNILELGHRPHESLAKLSKTYGPLMSLKLGNITTIVASSPKVAKEFLHKHDLAFSSRTVPDAVLAHNHHEVSILWLPVGDKWRNLRKICREQMFALQQLDASQGLRRKKVQELLDYVHECSSSCEAVDIGRAAFTTALNLISNTLFSKDISHHHSSSSQEFKDIVWALLEDSAKPNLADYFPILKWIDLQGIRRRTNCNIKKLIAILCDIIDERLQARASSVIPSSNKDVLEALLNLSQKEDKKLSCKDIRHLLMDLFIAGTDTTSMTVEWAMTELLRNPKIMAKAQNELKDVAGQNGLIQESDISRLPYLQAIVKETLRLHSRGPLLVPHKAEADVEINGFIVPKNAKILVNVWAYMQDSSIWLNPNSFLPERFLESKIDFRGQDFEFIPFSAGRRICPGLPLAYRMVHLMLASLLHSFDWKLEEGMKPEDMDMSDKFGLTLKKAMPMRAVATKRCGMRAVPIKV